MFWLMLYAHPRFDHAEYGVTDAAWASCFVRDDLPEDAEALARESLLKAGWDTEQLEEIRRVSRDMYIELPDMLEKYDQAIIDGVVVTLHTVPVGAPEE
ncbi:MAG: hypothetical protein ACYC0B_11010 [Gemmatimonadaceae bacterium]